MSHHVLARKWRPKTFADVIGQPHVVAALSNAIEQNRLHQAYLFTGTRGVGKTTLARILAKCLNCEQGASPTPCEQCKTCQEINAGNFVDLIEVDAASRTKVEDTKELLESAQYPPVKGKIKIYLIDEVHMLSTHSFNALLKTLEEPPAHLTFLLATTDPQKLPITVLSRCLQFTLRAVSAHMLTEHLSKVLNAENITFETNALQLIANAGNGSVRDTLSLADQAIALTNGNITLDVIESMLGTVSQDKVSGLINALLAQSPSQAFQAIEKLAQLGADFVETTKALASALHTIALHQWLPPDTQAVPTDNPNIAEWAKQFTKEDIQLYYQLVILGHRDLTLHPNLREGFEMLVLRLLTMDGYLAEHLATSSPAHEPPTETPAIPQSPSNAPQPTPKPQSIQSPTPAPAQPPIQNEPLNELPAHKQTPLNANAPSEPNTLNSKSNTLNKAKTPAELNWDTTTDQLQLSKSTLNLAKNCSLLSFQDNTLCLNLTPDREALKTSNSEQQLTQALQQHLNPHLKVSIQIGQSDTISPQQNLENTAKKDLESATAAIEGDPTIQDLKTKMGAMIKPNSITPI